MDGCYQVLDVGCRSLGTTPFRTRRQKRVFSHQSTTEKQAELLSTGRESHQSSCPSFAGRMVREFAVTARRDPQQPHEGAPHHVDVPESSGHGHLLEPFLGTFELTARRLHTRLKHVL